MSYIVFDIETAPLPNAADLIGEVEAPGNIKDAAKIAAAIEAKKAKMIEEAALSPLTGQVLVIGVKIGDNPIEYYEGDEVELLARFWEDYRKLRRQSNPLQWVGFNSRTFDWPYLIRRSWAHRLNTPPIFTERGYPLEHLIDLRDRWQLGDRQATGSLNSIAKCFGLDGKSGNGGEFAKLYATDREAALTYLDNDLRITRELAEIIL